MDYNKLSDRQINAAVAITFGEKIGQPVNGLQMLNIDGEYLCSTFDPCNNPADAWPIILANKIGILWLESEKLWSANSPGDLEEGCWDWSCTPDHWFDDSNPLRAAMIVFLMMQESE